MTPAANKSQFLKHIDLFDKSYRPSGMRKLREAARTRFAELPFPSGKTEDWRFTNVAPLLHQPFELAMPNPVDRQDLPTLPTREEATLVFVNGVYKPALSNPGSYPWGVYVGNLATGLVDF